MHVHHHSIRSLHAYVQIDLGDAEDVREVSGTYGAFEGAITLTSLRLVTSSRTWGPWGVENGTRFSITAPNGSSIAGFYARAGTRLVDAIGVYIRPVVPGRPRWTSEPSLIDSARSYYAL
jgi:hypothetical protein